MIKMAALATAALLAASAVSAAPVAMQDSPYAAARGIVNIVFADYLKDMTGVQVQTGVVDLNGDGKGEIVARFVHSSSCRAGMKACRTVVLMHGLDNWKIVLDRFAEKLDVASGYKDVPADITVDKMKWSWNGSRYLPDIAGLGDTIKLTDANPKTTASLYPSFGPGPAKLAAKGFNVKLSYSQDGLSEKKDLLVVKMDGDPVLCGKFTGCPVKVLHQVDGKWATVLSTATLGDIMLAKTVRQGYRDLIVQTRDGALELGWTGSSYAVADKIEGVKE